MKTLLRYLALFLWALIISNYTFANPSSNVLSATYKKTNVSICGCGKDGTITVIVSGGAGPYTYSWTGTNGYTAGNTAAVYNLPVGNYAVSIVDANLTKIVISDVHIESAFLVQVTNNGTVSGTCGNSGSIILYCNAGIAPYTYSLNGINYQCNDTFSGLAPGNYTAYVRDLAGCISSKPITVGLADPLALQPFTRPTGTCAGDGSIEVYYTGGVAPCTYSLNGSTYQASNVFNGLSAGSYTCYIKDSKGCLCSKAVSVGMLSPLAVSTATSPSSTCINNGTIQLTGAGGAAPYVYRLNGSTSCQSSNVFSGLPAGNYTAYIKDSKGCIAQKNVTVSLTQIEVTGYPGSASGCSATNGKIQLFRTGGFGPYTYSLNGNEYQSSNVFNNLAPGSYTGFVKDSRNCIGVLGNIMVGPSGCVLNEQLDKSKAGKVTKLPVVDNSLEVIAYPNPFSENFNLELKGFDENEKVNISITDLAGKRLFHAVCNTSQVFKFGNNMNRGVYILNVIQGRNTRNIKLVKE